jgi:recombination protein RecA
VRQNGDLALKVNGSDPCLRALNLTLDDLGRRFGQGIVMKLGEASHLQVQSIPTGFPTLDQALGVGGLPRGRITDIYGPEGSGKTTLCLHTIAEAQKHGGFAAFIDTEHALDPDHAAKCGVDLNRLYIAQPTTGEEALEIAEAMVRAGIELVVIDSAASLTPRAEIEGEMGDSHSGLQARLMSQALRKLAGPVRQNGTVLIFTNQLRKNPQSLFGSWEKPTGGMALRFHASIQIDLRRVRAIKSVGEVIGTRIRATIKKNKVAAPFKSAEFDIIYDERR